MTALPVESPLWKRVLWLALPTLAQQGLLFFTQMYDQWLAHRYSAEYRAALTTANYLYWFASSYSIVVSVGATALVGRAVGAGDRHLADRATAQTVWLALLFGGLAAAVALLGLPWLLPLLNLGDAPATVAARYLAPLAAVFPLQLLMTGGVACLIGAGDTRTGLWVLAGVTAVNVPVAWVCSHGGDPTIADSFTGIAIGTACSYAAGGVAVLLLLARGRSGLKLTRPNLRPDFPLLYRLLRVSVPAAFDSLSVACCQLLFLSVVNRLGPAESAAHGIALRWEALGYLAGSAFAPTAMAVVSQSLGQQRADRAERGGWAAFLMGGGAMTLMGVLFLVLAGPMCRAMTDDPREAELAEGALRLIAYAMPAVAAWIILTAALRAAGDTRVPVLISWAGFLGVRLPLAIFLTGKGPIDGWDVTGPGWGLHGAWVAMVTDLYVRGFLFVWRFASGRWKDIRV
ncbi:MAG: MATE family efflux transporter [Fimbriiglobus sp.]|jgi:putative MATE family efflux protein|nr:MATE family efflux transporter [Fimbriiglobus sp.]